MPNNQKPFDPIPEDRQKKELEAVYARAFKPSSDGFVALGDLNALFLFNHVDSNADHAFHSGQASVMKYIQAMIQEGLK